MTYNVFYRRLRELVLTLTTMTLLTPTDGADPGLRMVINRNDLTAALGADVTFICTVAGTNWNFFFNQIIWYKILPDAGEIQINTGAVVAEPFDATRRYLVEPHTTTTADNVQLVHMPLSIRNVSLADNGTYRCDFYHKQSVVDSISHRLIIQVPPISVQLSTGNQKTLWNESRVTFNFVESLPSAVSCVSLGGNPQPQLRVFRGKTDVSSEFQHSATSSYGSGQERGFETALYRVEMSAERWVAEGDCHGLVLRCVARVSVNRPDLKAVVSATMHVQFAPKFHCDRNKWSSSSHDELIVSCRVRANPPIDPDQLWWIYGERNSTKVSVGQSLPGFSSAAATTDTSDALGYDVWLRVVRVNFTGRCLYLTARNSIGQRDALIPVAEVPTTPITRPTTSSQAANLIHSIYNHLQTAKYVNRPTPAMQVHTSPRLLPPPLTTRKRYPEQFKSMNKLSAIASGSALTAAFDFFYCFLIIFLLIILGRYN